MPHPTAASCTCPSCLNPDPYLSVPEWAAYHRLTERYVRKLVETKRIEVTRVGRLVRLRRSLGDELFTNNTEPAHRPLMTGRGA